MLTILDVVAKNVGSLCCIDVDFTFVTNTVSKTPAKFDHVTNCY